MHHSAKMDSSEEDSGMLVGRMDWLLLSPFDLPQILPVGGGLLVMCSLPGSPGVKQLMQMVSVVPGLGVWLQSVFSLTGPKQ